MSEQNFTYPVAPTYPLYRLSTFPFEDGEAKEIMVKYEEEEFVVSADWE